VKAQHIAVFNTEHLSAMFERVIIASGTSNRQTKALAASVRDSVRSQGFQVMSTEGEDNGEWIIVDCGAAVAHIMQPAIREYYHLEEIWGGKNVKMKMGAVNTKLVKASEPEAPAAKPGRAAKTATKTFTKTVTKAAAPKTPSKAPATRAPAKKAAAPAPAKTPAARKSAVQTVVAGAPKKVAAKKAPTKTAARKAADKSAAYQRVGARRPSVKTAAKAAPKAAGKTASKPAAKAAAKPAAKPAAKAPARKTPRSA
jgi:ribosome-associated protein